MEISITWFADSKYPSFNVAVASKPGNEPFIEVKGCRIVSGKDGEFVSPPSTKNANTGKYWNHAYFSKEFAAVVLEKAKESQPKQQQQSLLNRSLMTILTPIFRSDMQISKDDRNYSIRKGTLDEIPKFDPVVELLKAGRYAKFGHAENTSGNSFYQITQNEKLNRCLSVLAGEMSSAEVAEKLGSSNSGAYKWLTKLGELGMGARNADRRIAGIGAPTRCAAPQQGRKRVCLKSGKRCGRTRAPGSTNGSGIRGSG